MVIQQHRKDINSNYMMMSQPYIGLFVDGAEKWCSKVGLEAPKVSEVEELYYTYLRQSHKLYDLSYSEYKSFLMSRFKECDTHFYNIRGLKECILGYYNVGVDLCNEKFVGNTVLCSMYTPVDIWNNTDAGPWVRDISVIAGKLAAFFGCKEYGPYRINDCIHVGYKDYHFYKNCPIKRTTALGFVLFSLLCSVNYAIEFIENVFVDEIPQKFKFAYLQYYYLVTFIEEINSIYGIDLYLNDSLINRQFRNCLAHYGLGQYLSESELKTNDPLMGLTLRAFNKDYSTTKKELYEHLMGLTYQIKDIIMLT